MPLTLVLDMCEVSLKRSEVMVEGALNRKHVAHLKQAFCLLVIC